MKEEWKEYMGHAYLRNFRDAEREECAKLLGIDDKSAKQLTKPFAVEYPDEWAEGR